MAHHNAPSQPHDPPAPAPMQGVLTRLRRVEGQVRGIQRMLQEDRPCEDVLTQLTAIRAGLDQVTLALLDVHVEKCVLGGSPADPEQLQKIQQAMRLIARYDSSPLPVGPDEP